MGVLYFGQRTGTSLNTNILWKGVTSVALMAEQRDLEMPRLLSELNIPNRKNSGLKNFELRVIQRG